MQPTRPNKRQRTSKNVFLDLEAAEDGGSDNEEGNDLGGFEQQIIDAEEDEVDGFADHFALFQLTRQAQGDEDSWTKLLKRAYTKSRPLNEEHAEVPHEVDYGYSLRENDLLWEIGCKVGLEEAVIFEIVRRAFDEHMPEPLAKSAVATHVPGRIYAEVGSFEEAVKLARSVSALNPSLVQPVPRERIMRVLNISSSRYPLQQWARVSGKKKQWRIYTGDAGFIQSFESYNKRFLALLPRLIQDEAEAQYTRPRQALAVRAQLEQRFGVDSIVDDIHGRYIWEGQLFTEDGLLLVDLDGIDILPVADASPTSSEFALFQSTTLLSSKLAAKTIKKMRQSRLKVGDRVKVVIGEYIGMVGEIREMIDDIEVVVYLPSQDLAENMPKNNVRASYSVGDQVKIVDGQHSGLLGWVVAVSSSMLRIVHIEGQIEVNVSVTEVAFSSATHIVGLQPRGEYPKWGKLGECNPNDVYIGKRVMIIGWHQLKGYKGGIKTTTPEGDAFVELDARLQRIVQVRLLDLCVLTDMDVSMSHILDRSREAPSTSLSQTEPTETKASTPAWDSSSHVDSDLGLAWEPCAPTPIPHMRPTLWLETTGLKGMRLKLKTDDPNSQSVEFISVENDQVKVRDKLAYRLLSFDAVHPLLPSEKGDLVTPMIGPSQGIIYKVWEYKDEQCVVRQPGTRPTKKYPDPVFPTIDLVQVLPAFR